MGLDESEVKKFFELLRIGCITIVVLVPIAWLLLVVGTFGLVELVGVKNPPMAVFLFGSALAALCVLLWIASRVRVVKLSKDAETRMWLALAAGVVIAVSSAVMRGIQALLDLAR